MTLAKLLLHKLILLALTMMLFIVGAAQAEVRVSAAASLTDALTEVANAYKKMHPDMVVKMSFAGSSTLAKQIKHGAPADIFISADKEWADYLEQRNLLNSESRTDLLANDLVIVAPITSKQTIQLTKSFDVTANVKGKLCTGEPAHVPAGKYAKQALEYYGWWNIIESHLVGTEDVRTALAFVERGECALGIVYKTDALMSKKVKVIARFPSDSHLPIVYPGALTKKAGSDASSFWQFLQSVTAANIFRGYGFNVSEQ